MLPDIQKYLVNWTEGMKLSKLHFQQLENALIDLIRDVSALNLDDTNYGLLPAEEFKNPTMHILEGQVVLKACRAVTRGGRRIEIRPEMNVQFKEALPSTPIAGKGYHVLLKVDAFQIGKEQGNIIDTVKPRRSEFRLPHYKLDVVPENSINLPSYYFDQAIIGRVKWQNNVWSEDKEYIPPCACIGGHNKLKVPTDDLVGNWEKLLEHTEKIAGIIKTQKQKDNVTPLVQELNTVVFQSLTPAMPVAKYALPSQSPFFIYQMIWHLAERLKWFINSLENVSSGGESTQQMSTEAYLFQFLGKAPYQLDAQDLADALTDIRTATYNHLNFLPFLNNSIKLVELLLPVFENLARQSQIIDKGSFDSWSDKSNNSFQNY